MHRLPSIVIIIVLYTIAADAQKTISQIQLKRKNPKDIQVLPSIEKMLLSYTYVDSNTGTDIRTALWVDSTGLSSPVPFSNFLNKKFIKILKFDSIDYLYFVDEENSSTYLRALVYDSKSNSFQIPETKISIDHDLLNIYEFDGQLVIVTYDKKTKELIVQNIEKLNTVSRRNYSLPVDLSQFYNKYNPPRSYQEGNFVNIYLSKASVKIFPNKNNTIITIDDVSHEELKSGKLLYTLKTIVLSLDHRSESVTSWEVMEKKPKQLSSFVYGNTLVRLVSTSKKITLKTYDMLSQQETSNFSIIRDSTTITKFGWLRSNRSKTITNKNKLYSIIKYSEDADPSVFAMPLDSTTIRFCWGHYLDDNPSGAMAGPGVVGMLAYIITSAILQTMDGPGISAYDYIDWKPGEAKFATVDLNKSTQNEKIDKYDLTFAEQKKELDYSYIFNLKNGTFGVYHFEKSDKIDIVKF